LAVISPHAQRLAFDRGRPPSVPLAAELIAFFGVRRLPSETAAGSLLGIGQRFFPMVFLVG